VIRTYRAVWLPMDAMTSADVTVPEPTDRHIVPSLETAIWCPARIPVCLVPSL
jgi:hypothetical protein